MPLLDRPRWNELRERAGSLSALTATHVFLLSFLGLVAVGTAGFLLLPGLYTGPGLGFVDALFTSASAVCVTGLVVVDTARYFTPAGQAWILLLIQLGGLGILTFTTLVIALLGRRTSLRALEAAGGHAGALRHLGPFELVRGVVGATVLLEAVGAVLLWLALRGELGAGGAVWPAVFHAVSAFCNAGFSIFPRSLEAHASAPLVLLTVSGLVILGGVGFLVLADARAVWRGRARRLSTHSRLVLGATGVLLASGTVLFLLFEVGNTLQGMGWWDRVTNAWFMSVTPRTAGFNSVDYDALTNPSLFLTILLMLVGGSPGSTAGGLKTTTLALMVLALLARLRGDDHVSVAGRTIPSETVGRAAGLALGGLLIVGAAVFLLAVVEMAPEGGTDRVEFLRLAFEAHSAFGTVGLSMGATSALSEAGRLIVAALMYVGRVGPLAVASAMAVAGRRGGAGYRYARQDVVIG